MTASLVTPDRRLFGSVIVVASLIACSGAPPSASPAPSASPSPSPSEQASPSASLAELSLPLPSVTYVGRREVTTPESNLTYAAYQLSVTNWSAFPAELFEQFAGMPPCGDDDGTTRLRVEVYDGTTNMLLVDWCGVTPAGLTNLLLNYPLTQQPPATVYLGIVDRGTGQSIRSDPVAISAPPSPTASGSASAPSPVATPTTYPSASGWAKPVLIAARRPLSRWYPSVSLAIGPDSRAYAAAILLRDPSNEDSEVAVYLVAAAPDGWTVSRATQYGLYEQPDVAIDGDGSAWIAFQKNHDTGGATGEPGIDGVFYTTNRAGSWSPAEQLGREGGFRGLPRIAVRNGVVHGVHAFQGVECWTDEPLTPGPECYVRYVTNPGGQWQDTPIDPVGPAEISLASDGLPRIAFTTRVNEYVDDAIGFATATGNGTFDIDFIASERSEGVQLLLDAADQPVIVASGLEWDEGAQRAIPHYFEIRRDGQNWDRQPIDAPFDHITGALGSTGKLHLIGWNEPNEVSERPDGLLYIDPANAAAEPVKISDADVWAAELGIGPDGRLQAVYINESGVWYTSRAEVQP